MAIVASTKIDGSMFPSMRAMLRDREIVIRLGNRGEAEALAEAGLHPQFTQELQAAIEATWPATGSES